MLLRRSVLQMDSNDRSRGKSGITQAIVGLTACLMMLHLQVRVLRHPRRHHPLPIPRVASQIVSRHRHLGAGIILTRHGAIRGLTAGRHHLRRGDRYGLRRWPVVAAGFLPTTSSSLRWPARRIHPHARPGTRSRSASTTVPGALPPSSRRSAPWAGRCRRLRAPIGHHTSTALHGVGSAQISHARARDDARGPRRRCRRRRRKKDDE